MKKWILSFLAAWIFFWPTPIFAATTMKTSLVQQPLIHTQFYTKSTHSEVQNLSFKLGSRFRSSRGTRSYSFGRSSSGSRSNGFTHTYNTPLYRPTHIGSSIGSHLLSFGAGWLLGGMFHPFGGYYGYGYHHFSLLHLLIDLALLWFIWRLIRRFFF